ncbi:MAG TPA: hypothetical protein VJH05_00875 [Candidatus Paceibacterota bacterium]
MITPSQQILNIEEIRDGVLILKDGSLKVVLMASSLNFALKSADEQTAIILQYQNFLNSLDFSVQFFMQSRKINIEPYLDTLKETKEKQENELLQIQISEYIEFIRTFVKASNIVNKNFYVVVPFIPPVFETKELSAGMLKNLLKSIWGSQKTSGEQTLSPQKFEEYKNQLWQRMENVITGLVRSGVRAVPLNTEELIELFYGLYNPGELEKGKPPTITT